MFSWSKYAQEMIVLDYLGLRKINYNEMSWWPESEDLSENVGVKVKFVVFYVTLVRFKKLFLLKMTSEKWRRRKVDFFLCIQYRTFIYAFKTFFFFFFSIYCFSALTLAWIRMVGRQRRDKDWVNEGAVAGSGHTRGKWTFQEFYYLIMSVLTFFQLYTFWVKKKRNSVCG